MVILAATECADLINLYEDAGLFRNKITMQRHNFGQGEYQYFDYPLPPLVESLRRTFYARLVPIAQNWVEKLGLEAHYPDTLEAFLDDCQSHGQTRPTPLLLKYGLGDFNRLHQDLYGDVAFPLQLAVCLSRSGGDYEGGEFVLTEQRPRFQTQVEVIQLGQGDAVIFANRYRPTKSIRGYSRLNIRHGVSRVRQGHRYCLGIIFHDAK